MLGLRAVVPHGLGVHDADGVCEELRSSADGGIGRHITREESVGGVSLHITDGHARLVESRLGNGVVLPSG